MVLGRTKPRVNNNPEVILNHAYIVRYLEFLRFAAFPLGLKSTSLVTGKLLKIKRLNNISQTLLVIR